MKSSFITKVMWAHYRTKAGKTVMTGVIRAVFFIGKAESFNLKMHLDAEEADYLR